MKLNQVKYGKYQLYITVLIPRHNIVISFKENNVTKFDTLK